MPPNFRKPDVEIQSQRGGYLILEELSQTPVLWINSAQQLALIKS
jgi:hypothetical protein